MRYSLRILLALCLAGLQLIAVLAVVFSSYFTSEKALIAHARHGVGPVRAPKTIHIVDSLPRNALGKVQKRQLRQELIEKLR